MKMNNKKHIIDNNLAESNPEIVTSIKIVVGILIFFLVVYCFAGLLTGEIKLKKNDKKSVEIQYSEILADNVFKQNSNDYFVIFYEFDDDNSSLIQAISSDLSHTASVYSVDLSKKFNSSYISDSSLNRSPKNINELKVKNPTMIRIKSKGVVEFLTGIDKIKDYTLKLK